MASEFEGEEVYRNSELGIRVVKNPRDNPPQGYVIKVGERGYFIAGGILGDLINPRTDTLELERRLETCGIYSRISLEPHGIEVKDITIALLHTALREEKERADYFMGQYSKLDQEKKFGGRKE